MPLGERKINLCGLEPIFSFNTTSLQKKVRIGRWTRDSCQIIVQYVLMNNMFDLNQGNVVNLKKIDKILNEKATVLKTFNNVILELTYEADVDTLQTEIQDSSNLQIVYQNTVQWCIE